MRLLLHVQMEGVTGINAADLSIASPVATIRQAGMRELLTTEVSLVLTLSAKFFDSVTVVDAYSPLAPCLQDQDLALRQSDQVVHDCGTTPLAPPLAEADRFTGYDAMVMIGAHGMTGAPGDLSHTLIPGAEITLAGRPIGEVTLEMLAAAEAGVPTLFVAGDDAAVLEARRALPTAPGVCSMKSAKPSGSYLLRDRRSATSRLTRDLVMVMGAFARLTPRQRQLRAETLINFMATVPHGDLHVTMRKRPVKSPPLRSDIRHVRRALLQMRANIFGEAAPQAC